MPALTGRSTHTADMIQDMPCCAPSPTLPSRHKPWRAHAFWRGAAEAWCLALQRALPSTLQPVLLPALLTVLLTACGGQGADGGAQAGDSPERFAVLGRNLSWERLGEAAPPLTLAWTAESGLEQWIQEFGLESANSPTSAQQSPVPRLIRPDGRGKVWLDSPLGAELATDVLHWLTLRGQTQGEMTLHLQWRAEGEDFSDQRASSPMTLTASEQSQTWSVPLSSLRGALSAGDVSEGVAQFRLLFQGRGSSLSLESVVLSSDFDTPFTSPVPTLRLAQRGVLRDGVILRGAGSLRADWTPAPRERLRLSLALAGATEAVEVVLRDAAGLLPARRLRCEPGAEWQDVAIDLSALNGASTQLVLELSPHGNPLTTLFVGSVLRMAPDPQPLPNVIVYLEDTLRADHLGSYGHSLPTDPHLQRMAQAGTLFEQTFAASSWTRPAVSTLHTSLDPFAHGNVTHNRKVSLAADTLAESLAQAGYLTASFVTNYHGGTWSGLDQGFDMAREPTANQTTQVKSTLTSAAIADSLDAYLMAHADERLFVFVHSLDPHQPFEPESDDLYTMTRRAPAAPSDPVARELADLALRYDSEILHNDRFLERLDSTLESLGQAESTVFVFTSDHGEAFGEHGQRHHRQSLFQEELHVPWLLRWPKRIAAGRRVDAWAGHLDLAPTLLGLLELQAPQSWQGRDLSPLVLPPDPDASSRSAASQTGLDLGRPVLSHFVEEDDRTEWMVVARAPYKLLLPLGPDGQTPGAPRLVHLGDDPLEKGLSLEAGQLQEELSEAERSARDALLQWALRTMGESRASALQGESEAMDPALQQWMREMGYLK